MNSDDAACGALDELRLLARQGLIDGALLMEVRLADERIEVLVGAGAPLRSGAAALKQTGGGALVQITGGSSRRAMPGRGLWAAGAFATRALVQAAAQELRAEGIHVALLAVDATIESPKTEAFTRGQPTEALADMGEVAKAVAYLVEQGPRAYTHDLTVPPAGERWVP